MGLCRSGAARTIDPADNAVLYGIQSKNGLKGVLVNSYGYQSEPMTDAIARKLRITGY